MKKIFLLLISVLFCVTANAQILSGTVEGNNFIGTSSSQWASITPLGIVSDVVVVAHVYWNFNNITQVTYGGFACSLVDRQTGNNNQAEDLWLCHNPSHGTQSIEMSIESGSHRVIGYAIPYANTNGIGNRSAVLYTMSSAGSVHLINSIAVQSSNNVVTSYLNWVANNTFPLGIWNSDNTLINVDPAYSTSISYQLGRNGVMGWSTANAWGNSKIVAMRIWEMISTNVNVPSPS